MESEESGSRAQLVLGFENQHSEGLLSMASMYYILVYLNPGMQETCEEQGGKYL